MSKIGLKLTMWWPKQSSLIEKVKTHRARILFWKSVKTWPKWFAEPKFFYFVLDFGSNGASPQKMSKIGLQLTMWWPKQSSLIEKIKRHRDRILFVNDNFSNSHCPKQTPNTCIGHSNCFPACVYCIFGLWNCLGNINTNCRIFLF